MQIKILALTAITTLTSFLHAGNDMICFPDLCIKGYAGVDALYWKSCGAEDFFGLLTTPTTSRQEQLLILTPNYQWGFRLFGLVSDLSFCNFASLEWARVEGTTSLTAHAGGKVIEAFTTTELWGRVFSSYGSCFNRVSIKFGHRFCGDNCSSIHAFIGARYAEVRERRFLRADEPVEGSSFISAQETIRTSFSGGGLEVGLDACYNVWCDFSIHARAGLLALITRPKFRGSLVKRATSTSLDSADVSVSGGQTSCIGGYDLRIGLTYTYKCRCCCLRGEIGYEYEQYLQALLQSESIDTTAQRPRQVVGDTFSIGGLYFGVAVCF